MLNLIVHLFYYIYNKRKITKDWLKYKNSFIVNYNYMSSETHRTFYYRMLKFRSKRSFCTVSRSYMCDITDFKKAPLTNAYMNTTLHIKLHNNKIIKSPSLSIFNLLI